MIAIDGTAGSGKGTLATNLSKKLNFDHLDTGLLYRIYAFESIKEGKEKQPNKINFNKWFTNTEKLDCFKVRKNFKTCISNFSIN
ncbi:MAG: hypothetical protein CM15mP40_01660 [Alphaproteobacteria bacterium]|nr:MAG: hypothetical protein CM15mP40_01660 [Alphaproteobacteria bacterium]